MPYQRIDIGNLQYAAEISEAAWNGDHFTSEEIEHFCSELNHFGYLYYQDSSAVSRGGFLVQSSVPVGLCLYRVERIRFRKPALKFVVHFCELSVKPEFQRKRIASGFIRMIQDTKAVGNILYRAYVPESNLVAQLFWRSRKFRCQGVEKFEDISTLIFEHHSNDHHPINRVSRYYSQERI